MQALFEALQVDPLNIIALVFAWKLKAKVPFEFTRTEFVNGCILLNCDSIGKLKTVLRMCCPLPRSILVPRPCLYMTLTLSLFLLAL